VNIVHIYIVVVVVVKVDEIRARMVPLFSFLTPSSRKPGHNQKNQAVQPEVAIEGQREKTF
jgi:hypothetical protein